jgi:hypothetical protein
MVGLTGRPARGTCRHYDGRVAESQEIGTMPGPNERGGESESPQVRTTDGGYGTDPPQAHDRPAKGSVDDLRQRQNGLPHGHPSSRFNDDGRLKPPLVPLKNLELPDDERETNGAGRDQAKLDRRQASDSRANGAGEHEPSALTAQARLPDARPPQARPPEARPPEARPPEARPPEARPPEARPPEARWSEAWQPEARWSEAWQPEARQPEDSQPEAREQQGSAGQQDARDEPAAENRWATPERESAAQAPELTEYREVIADGQLPREADAISGYGHDAEADADADAAADAGVDRGAGTDSGPTTQHQESLVDDPAPSSVEQRQPRSAEDLTPEQVRIAVRALGRCRLAEGRSVFGSYGERGLTPAMRRIEDELEHGGLVSKTEKYALKSLDRFQEKLAKRIARFPGADAADLAEGIHDGIRYTFVFEADHYVDGIDETRSKIEEEGYELIEMRPSWHTDEYKGTNSRWRDSSNGVLFEVQWHTPASWEAKQKTHEAYEKIENTETSLEEKERLRAYQREVCATVPVPPGALEMRGYKKEARYPRG